MSGIINSAGSKSGVIGTTELDYETGTWTATFTGAGGSAGSAATTTNSATYTRIGRIILWTCDFTVDNIGSWTSSVRITGFPFTVTAGDYTHGGYPIWHSNLEYDGESIGIVIPPSYSRVEFVNLKDDASITACQTSQFDNGARCMCLGQAWVD